MKNILLVLLFISTAAYGDVAWDVSPDELGLLTGKRYIKDLAVGESATIDSYAIYCTNSEGNLAINSLTELTNGSVLVTLLENHKIGLVTKDQKELLGYLVDGDSYASCEWWTSHKGKYILTVDNINGAQSVSELVAKP